MRITAGGPDVVPFYRQDLCDEVERRHGRGLIAERTVKIKESLERHRFDKLRQGRSADRVEHDTRSLSPCDFVDRFHQILFFGRDDILGAGIGEMLALGTGASERDRLRTDRIGDLDCCKPYAARCARNHHGVL